MKTINGKQYIEKDRHSFTELQELIRVLLGPEGCEWNRSQTHESLKKYMREEADEVCMAIENKDQKNLCEELGDVLWQVVLHSEIAAQEGLFTFDDVVQQLCEKMIRRHPHVFGDMENLDNAADISVLWKDIKKKEKEDAGKEPV